jgi:LytS/YehU family sensor histidine kinase
MNSSTSPANIEDALRYQAETQLLRAQLNGDFLCNSLVVLQSCLIGGEPKIERLKTVINGLADYYRYAVAAQRDGTSPLAEEWEAVRGFLTVQKIRYAEGLQVESELSEEALDFPVPRIFLQPLVDNAVKYGRKTGELPVKVRIRASCPKRKTLQMEVSNTGSWYERENRSPHVSGSLDNLRQRLAALYPGKKHEMTVSATDSWVNVKIRLSLS